MIQSAPGTHISRFSRFGPGTQSRKARDRAPGTEPDPNLLLAGVDGLSLFDERLHPAEDARPSLGVIDSCLWRSRKSLLTNSHQVPVPTFCGPRCCKP